MLQMMGDKHFNGMHITNYNFYTIFYIYVSESKHTTSDSFLIQMHTSHICLITYEYSNGVTILQVTILTHKKSICA